MVAIEQIAQKLIRDACCQNASDIHILPRRDDYIVYLRQNGSLVEYSRRDHSWGKKLISYFKFQTDLDVGEKRKPQSGACEFDTGEERVELRISTITSVSLLESLVIRLLKPQKNKDSSVNTYFPKDLDTLRKLVKRKSGLILFSGPVGSGKTTTIYQLLRERSANENLQVITMEDPVEIIEEDFLQTQVNEQAGIGYDTLIKASLRHHPDILLVGEIRDEETARMTIRAALTGHLVLATIHAKDSRGVIARMQELKITNQQLSQTLIGITSQRLIPRFCSNCQGDCCLDCTNLDKSSKRSGLFEILAGDDLALLLDYGQVTSQFTSLNHQLRKAWAYGYIDSKNFLQFELI